MCVGGGMGVGGLVMVVAIIKTITRNHLSGECYKDHRRQGR